MKKPMRHFSKNRGVGGFTLIEMLIVIAVIAILAGVVLTGVSGFQASARDTRRIGDLRNVQNHLELFFNKCGHYPVAGSSASNCGTPGGSGTLGWSALQSALSSVTSKVPNDPVSSRNYEYGYGPDGLDYIIKATLERDNSTLQDDAESAYGITCDDASLEFCVRS